MNVEANLDSVLFAKFKARMESVLAQLVESLPVRTKTTAVKNMPDGCCLELYIFGGHRTCLDVKFEIVDFGSSTLDEGDLADDSQYGNQGNFRLSVVEEHSDPSSACRTVPFDAETGWLDYSDEAAWEARLQKIERSREALSQTVSEWLEEGQIGGR